MINNESDKPEELVPEDSQRKNIRNPRDSQEAVVKPNDRTYDRENANFGNVAKKKENEAAPSAETAKKPAI